MWVMICTSPAPPASITSSIACLAYLTYLKEVISCDVSPVAMFIFPTPQCSVTTAATKCNRMTIATKSNSCSWNAIARVYIYSVLLVLIGCHSDLLMMIIGSNDAAVGWVASPARAVMATLPSLTVTAMAKVGNTHRQNWSRGCEMATVLLHCVPLWEREEVIKRQQCHYLPPLLLIDSSHCYASHRFPGNNTTSALFNDDLLHWQFVCKCDHRDNMGMNTQHSTMQTSWFHYNNSNDGVSRCWPPPPLPCMIVWRART